MEYEKRSEYVSQRAYELAMSGTHISAITIVSALVNEGYPEAADILNADLIRADLQSVCVRYWKGVAVDSEQPAAAVTYLASAAEAPPERRHR